MKIFTSFAAGVLQVVVVCALLASCSKAKEAQAEKAIPFTVTRIFPHDPKAFTQGLTIDRGRLLESTGQDASWIALVDIATGRQDKKIQLDKKYFGEGICIFGSKLYQLTWRSHIGFVYDARSFAKKGEFTYPYEGWGITHDAKNLIVSDGTEKLHFLDSGTLKDVRSVSVHDSFGPVQYLNELEYIEGFVYANQWQTNYIVKIDPADGSVAGRMDFSDIAAKIRIAAPNCDVLNGIAYDKQTKLMLVTGKLWPSLLAVKLK